VTALVQAGASRDASDFEWWTGLLVEAIGRQRGGGDDAGGGLA
jgi:hypothetical protein